KDFSLHLKGFAPPRRMERMNTKNTEMRTKIMKMNTPQNPMALSGLTDKPMKKPSPCPLPTILHRLAETLRLDSAYPRVVWLSLLVFMAALCADTARAQNTRPMSM